MAETRIRIPEAMLPFAQEKKRFKVVLGGRGSAKSMTLAQLAVVEAM